MLNSENKNILCVVEGTKTEFNFIKHFFDSLLSEKGVGSKISNPLPSPIDSAKKFTYPNNKINVFVMHPQKNQLHIILKEILSTEDSTLENVFSLNGQGMPDDFMMRFLCFDVDYNDYNTLYSFATRFNDPYDDGMLLLSSPCMESFVDFHNKTFELSAGQSLDSHYKKDVAQSLQEICEPKSVGMLRFLQNNLNTCIVKNIVLCENKWKEHSLDEYSILISNEYKGLKNKENGECAFPIVLSHLFALGHFIYEYKRKKDFEEDVREKAKSEPLYKQLKEAGLKDLEIEI